VDAGAVTVADSMAAAGISIASASVWPGTCAAALAEKRKITARNPELNAQLLNTPLGRVLLVIAFASGERIGS
jgi:hypothetical protein